MDNPSPMPLSTVSSDDLAIEYANGKLRPIGISMIAMSSVYILLMLTNLGIYVPRIVAGGEDALMASQTLMFVGIIVITNGFIIFGASRMLARRSYTLSIISLCFALIPTLGPCVVLGIPLGIWGLWTITSPEIRRTFL